MTHCSTSSTMTATPATKKTRRFSLIRIFNNNNSSNNSGNGSDAHSNSSSRPSSPSMHRAHYRHSMVPSMDTMQTDMMHERRKSIAALTESSLRSMSLDLRPSAIRPILSRKQTPQIEMTEKMRQFDELLQTRRSTIRISLTPSLLQEP